MSDKKVSHNPLAEVFGFFPGDFGTQATRFRKNKLCPYNNKVPSCTKDKANNPLGACSIYHKGEPVITCPIRFRQDWIIAEDSAAFFFEETEQWTSLVEVKLADRHGKSAGNIDIVLVSYDEKGRIKDFGSVEVQAVYISGNVRDPFEAYIEDPSKWENIDWKRKVNSGGYPKPDYLSSSRKRLMPQMLYKGGILYSWGIKQSIAVQTSFFETLPSLPEVDKEEAAIAWFLYDLKNSEEGSHYTLEKNKVVYTQYWPAVNQITTPQPGKKEDFIKHLQSKLDQKLDNPPDAPTILELPFDED